MVVKNDGSIEVNLDNKNILHTISTDMIKNIDIKAAIAQPLNGADQPTIKGIHGLRKSKEKLTKEVLKPIMHNKKVQVKSRIDS